MIDLTPLDVRKKRGDFKKGLRGYEPQDVDTFLELVAERLEELVRENLTLNERTERLSQQVQGQEGRERAVQDALVTAQELREEIKAQAHREADSIVRDAQAQADRILQEADRSLDERRKSLRELSRQRVRFLKAFRLLLEREMDVVQVEEGSEWAEDFAMPEPAPAPEPSPEPEPELEPGALDALLADDEDDDTDLFGDEPEQPSPAF